MDLVREDPGLDRRIRGDQRLCLGGVRGLQHDRSAAVVLDGPADFIAPRSKSWSMYLPCSFGG